MDKLPTFSPQTCLDRSMHGPMVSLIRASLVLGLLHLASGMHVSTACRAQMQMQNRLRSAKMAEPAISSRTAVAASSKRVVDAARKFGSAQADAAEAWVELAKVYAVAGKVPSREALLQQDVALFTDCLLDEDADKCKELDSALREILALLDTQGKGAISDFVTSVKLKVVAARVRAAATPFGPEQASAAALWVQQALTDGGSRDTSDLMENDLRSLTDVRLSRLALAAAWSWKAR